MAKLAIADIKSTDVVVVRTKNNTYVISNVNAETGQAEIEGGAFGCGWAYVVRLDGIVNRESEANELLLQIEIGKRLVVARAEDGLYLHGRVIILSETAAITINGDPVGE